MKFYQEKIVKLKDADVHVHFANNKGRGKDNVTLTFVYPGIERERTTRDYNRKNILRQMRTSGWAGNYIIPDPLINLYGGMVKESFSKANKFLTVIKEISEIGASSKDCS